MGASASAPWRGDPLDADARAAADDDDDDGTRLAISKSVLFAIFLGQFYVGASAITPRVMAVFLVRTWYHASSEAVIGPLTGVLLAAFSAARVSTPALWAAAVDATRSPKWLIVATSVAGGVANAYFMVAPSFWPALAARAAAGALTLPCSLVRCVVRAASPTARDEAAGMAARTLGLGAAVMVVPPAIGGLATPCAHMLRSLAHTRACDARARGWLVTHPFALTAAFLVVTGAVSTVVSAALLPNVRCGAAAGTGERVGQPHVDLLFRPNLRKGVAPGRLAAAAAAAVADVDASRRARGSGGGGGDSVEQGRGDSVEQGRGDSVAAADDSGCDVCVEMGGFAVATPRSRPPSPPPRQQDAPSRLSAVPESVFGSGQQAPPAAAPPHRLRTAAALSRRTTSARLRASASSRLESALSGAALYVGTRGFAAADAVMGNVAAAAGAAVAQARADGDYDARAAAAVAAGADGARPPPPPWWRSRHAVAAVTMHGCQTALFDGAFDLVALTATARGPRDAVPGIGFAGLAWIVTLGGAGLLASSLALYPRLAARAGPARAVQIGLAVGAVGSALVAAATVASPVAAVRAAQAAAQTLYGVSGGLASSGAQVMVLLAAPSGAIGAVSAAGNDASAAARVVAPLAAGGLWAVVAAPEAFAAWIPATMLCALFVVTLVAGIVSERGDSVTLAAAARRRERARRRRGGKEGAVV